MSYFIAIAAFIILGFVLSFFKNRYLSIASDIATLLGNLGTLWICYDILQGVIYILQMLSGRVI